MKCLLAAALVFLTCDASVKSAENDAASAYLRRDYAHEAATESSKADRGDPIALYNLGCMAAYGKGVPADREKAMTLFENAAKGGDLDAKKWIEAARSNPNPNAILWYTRPVQKPASPDRLRLSFREPIDGGQELVALCRTDAEDGAAVDFMIGVMFENGNIGLPKDERQAAAFYERASAKGSVASQTKLAYLFASGRGVQRDLAKAAALLRAAAAKGERTALSNVAHFFETGQVGYRIDPVAAYALYTVAAEKGEKGIAPKALILLSANLTDAARGKAADIAICLTRGGETYISLQCVGDAPP